MNDKPWTGTFLQRYILLFRSRLWQMSRVALAATIAVLLVIIVAAATVAVRRYDNYLEGMWSGDPGYMETAQLNDFQLYIGPSKDGKREGYLIMVDNTGAFVANQPVEVIEPPLLSRWLPALRNSFKTHKDAFSLEGVRLAFTPDNGTEPPFPEALKLTVSILDGTLTLSGDDKIYAFLEKDIAASSAAAEIGSSVGS